MKNLYDILELKPDASEDAIKKAYRRLALERHPDSDPGNPWAEDDFKELSAAYEILSNPLTRDEYDRGLLDGGSRREQRGQRRPGSGAKSAGEPKDKKPGKRKAIKIKGADVDYALSISFLEAAKGAVKHVSMAHGKRLKVSIPAGTDDKAVLRLKGQGMRGLGGGADGDALVEVAVDDDPLFRRDGKDLHIDLAVTLPEAILGGRVEAPTIDGPVKLTIPPGSNTGTALRLKGKGLPSGPKGGGPKGDQYVTLKVVLPKKPDKALREFMETWTGEHPYTVRKDA